MSQVRQQISFKKHPQQFLEHYLEVSDLKKKKLIHHIQIKDLPEFITLLEPNDKDFFYHSLTPSKQVYLIKHLASDELVYWMKESDYQSSILSQIDIQKKHLIEKMLMYHERRVGSMMQVDLVTIQSDQTAGEVLKYIIHDVSEYFYMDILWVIDSDNKVIGKVSLSDVLIARKNTKISSIMTHLTTFLNPHDDITIAIQKMMDYDKEAIAVIEHEQLVGIITSDDVFDALIESYELDFQKLANINNFEETDSAIIRYQKRMPWLIIALSVNTTIALILAIFEPTLSQIGLLVLFQPLILGMAGNISTQALGVTLLTLDETNFNLKKHRQKEVRIGLMNASIMSVISFIFSSILLLFIEMTLVESIITSIQVSLALWMGMTSASLIGLMMPILLKKFNKDPAVASGPLITTLNDFIGLFIYFSIASLFLAIL